MFAKLAVLDPHRDDGNSLADSEGTGIGNTTAKSHVLSIIGLLTWMKEYRISRE
jgi:hypothetical protein